MLEEVSGNDELLNFAGSIENPKRSGVPKQTFHRRPSNEAKPAKNLHSLIDDLKGSLCRVKLGNCGFARDASLGRIVLPSGTIHQECSCIYADRHLGKLGLDKLVF